MTHAADRLCRAFRVAWGVTYLLKSFLGDQLRNA